MVIFLLLGYHGKKWLIIEYQEKGMTGFRNPSTFLNMQILLLSFSTQKISGADS